MQRLENMCGHDEKVGSNQAGSYHTKVRTELENYQSGFEVDHWIQALVELNSRLSHQCRLVYHDDNGCYL